MHSVYKIMRNGLILSGKSLGLVLSEDDGGFYFDMKLSFLRFLMYVSEHESMFMCVLLCYCVDLGLLYARKNHRFSNCLQLVLRCGILG